MNCFNNLLDVHDLKIEMVISILIHGLLKGPSASALTRNPLITMEELIEVLQQYMQVKEINVMKNGEWADTKPHRYDRKILREHDDVGRNRLIKEHHKINRT